MSVWTCVKGMIQVDGEGRTQPEIEYILKTIIDHLPKVSGSEGNMDVHLIRAYGHNVSTSHDEFGVFIRDDSSRREMQSRYLIVVDGDLRDRYFEETYHEFIKWLIRLAKRTPVDECVVRVSGWSKESEKYKVIIVNPDDDRLYDLYEEPSWTRTYESLGVAWWEYLMWNKPRDAKGALYEGKPDFSNGRWLDDMSEEEKRKIFETASERRKGRKSKE